MKRVTILAVLMACMAGQHALAQETKVGVEAGMNLSHFKTSNNFGVEQVGHMKPGYQLGVTVDHEFKSRLMLLTGLYLQHTQSEMGLQYCRTSPDFPYTQIKLNQFTLPLKLGYNLHIGKKLSLIPSAGLYASYNFNAGRCDIDVQQLSTEAGKGWVERQHYKPMDGGKFPVTVDGVEDYQARLEAFRHWTYGAIGGLKAIINKRYTVSVDYFEDIRKVQKQNNLRNYGWKLNFGYRF